MVPQIKLSVWNKETYVSIDTDDPSRCVFVGNYVYTDIKKCGYYYRGLCINVDPAEFLKENEAIINKLSDSRKLIPCLFFQRENRITILLKKKTVHEGDLMIYFKKVSIGLQFHKEMVAKLKLERFKNETFRCEFLGDWYDDHHIPTKYLSQVSNSSLYNETEIKKIEKKRAYERERTRQKKLLKTYSQNLVCRGGGGDDDNDKGRDLGSYHSLLGALDKWLPKEIDSCNERSCAEKDQFDWDSFPQRQITANPEEQYLADLDFIGKVPLQDHYDQNFGIYHHFFLNSGKIF
jgi:hypothetical protein